MTFQLLQNELTQIFIKHKFLVKVWKNPSQYFHKFDHVALILTLHTDLILLSFSLMISSDLEFETWMSNTVLSSSCRDPSDPAQKGGKIYTQICCQGL